MISEMQIKMLRKFWFVFAEGPDTLIPSCKETGYPRDKYQIMPVVLFASASNFL